MESSSGISKKTVRRVLSVALILWGGRLLYRLIGAGYEGFGSAIFAMAAWLFACILLYPDVARFPVAVLHRLIDSIYLPGSGDAPPLDYRLANYLRDAGKLQRAVNEYMKIAHHYPQEFTAYREAIAICLQCEDVAAARAIYKKALRKLNASDARLELRRHYESLL
ncbi:MAG: hypothetical protein WCO60_18895 [Verrucomicrobiota bacterium]